MGLAILEVAVFALAVLSILVGWYALKKISSNSEDRTVLAKS